MVANINLTNIEHSNRLSKKDMAITPQQLTQMYKNNQIRKNFKDLNNFILNITGTNSLNLYGNEDCRLTNGISFTSFQFYNQYGFGNNN